MLSNVTHNNMYNGFIIYNIIFTRQFTGSEMFFTDPIAWFCHPLFSIYNILPQSSSLCVIFRWKSMPWKLTSFLLPIYTPYNNAWLNHCLFTFHHYCFALFCFRKWRNDILPICDFTRCAWRHRRKLLFHVLYNYDVW